MKLKKLLATLAVGFAAGSVFALPSATTVWTPNVQNTLSDDFVEVLLEPLLGFGFGTANEIDVGDILFTAVGITSYAPNTGAASSSVKELTLLSAIQVVSKTVLPNVACLSLSAPINSCASFGFAAPGTLGGPALSFSNLLASQGISLTNPAGLTLGSNSVAVVMEGDAHDFSVAGSIPAAFAGAANGDLRAVLDLNPANGDSWTALGPISLGLFGSQVIGRGIGSFDLDLTIASQAFAGWDIGTELTGNGNLRRTPNALAPAGGDASFFFTPTPVPEPGSLALVALGLLGLSVAQRRKAVKAN